MSSGKKLEKRTNADFNRRFFLKSAVALAGTSLVLDATGLEAKGSNSKNSKTNSATYDCGVASGDPTSSSVVIWTRVIDTYHNSDLSDLDVFWEVSLDETFSAFSIVASGTYKTGVESDHTVSVEVTELAPFTMYYYRFYTETGYKSVIGRTLTAPLADDNIEEVRFVFLSCENYSYGWYNVLESMRNEDLHFVVFLGDSIYEVGGSSVRLDDIGGGTSKNLTEYREKYKLYLSDPNLREARRLFPWFVTWDDHEVEDNYAGTELTKDRDKQRQKEGYQAFREYMPFTKERQVVVNDEGKASLQIYRSFNYGSLVDLFMLDQRQYRDGVVCGRDFLLTKCDEVYDPNRTLLGVDQKEWFKNSLVDSTSQWKIVANPVMIMELVVDESLEPFYSHRLKNKILDDSGLILNADQWDGYPAERTDILSWIDSQAISDVVFITGDIHNCYVGELKPDFDSKDSPSVAVEFVGGSITSSGIAEYLGGKDFSKVLYPMLAAHNPHLKYLDAKYHVYTRMTITPEKLRTTYIAVNTITETTYETFTLKSFDVMSGSSKVIPVTE